MVFFIILIGVLMAASGLVLLLRPSMVIGFLERRDESAWLYVFGVGMRLVLGLLLVQAADQSRYPLIMAALGWILLAAALFLAALGPKRFLRLIRWLLKKLKSWSRAGGLVAMLFGALLLYAFI